MKKDKWFYVLALAYMAFLLFCVFGCSPAKIGQAAVKKYKESSDFPADCALHFPPIVKEGETRVDTAESVEVDCEQVVELNRQYWEWLESQSAAEKKALSDSLKALIARGQLPPPMKFKCPPSTHTYTRDTLIDKAAQDAAERKLAEANVKHAAEIATLNAQVAAQNKWKRQRNISYGVNAFFVLAVAAAVYFRSKGKVFRSVA